MDKVVIPAGLDPALIVEYDIKPHAVSVRRDSYNFSGNHQEFIGGRQLDRHCDFLPY